MNKTKNEIKSGRDLLTKLQTDVEKSQVDSQHISSSVATEGNVRYKLWFRFSPF